MGCCRILPVTTKYVLMIGMKDADGEVRFEENNVLVNLCVKRKLLLVYENVDPHVDALIKQGLSALLAWWGDDNDFMRWQSRRGRVRTRHLG